MTTLPDPVLTPFPSEERGAPWPTTSFERAAAPEGAELDALLDAVMDPEGPIRTTYAALVLLGGRIVGERYGGALPSFTHEPTPVVPSTPLLSWSMAKSMLAVIVGILVDRGELDLDDPANVPEWREPGDPRGAITLRNLLEMRDGLDFVEDYTDERASDVIEMLFGAGQADMAHFAASAVPKRGFRRQHSAWRLTAAPWQLRCECCMKCLPQAAPDAPPPAPHFLGVYVQAIAFSLQSANSR